MDRFSISYLDQEEDPIELEVNRAIERPLGSHLDDYVRSIAAQCAMMGIDVRKPTNTRKIYYVESNECE